MKVNVRSFREQKLGGNIPPPKIKLIGSLLKQSFKKTQEFQ